MRSITVIIVSLAVLLPAGSPALAGGDPPEIVEVVVRVAGGHLLADVSCRGLFSDRIRGTVQSGLPAVVELFVRLTTTRAQETVSERAYSYELLYDVWEDVYSVAGPETTTWFGSFAAMRGAVEELSGVRVAPLGEIDGRGEYRAGFGIAVSPLRGTRDRDLEDWVDRTNRNRTGGSWHEQVLNLNDLIGHFFSRRKGASNRSDWFVTDPFRPDALSRKGGDAP